MFPKKLNPKFSLMEKNQSPVPNLNEMINKIMNECVQGEEEVHLEPQSEIVMNAEPETRPVVEELTKEERAAKRQKTVRRTEEEETESDKDFVST